MDPNKESNSRLSRSFDANSTTLTVTVGLPVESSKTSGRQSNVVVHGQSVKRTDLDDEGGRARSSASPRDGSDGVLQTEQYSSSRTTLSCREGAPFVVFRSETL